MGTAGAGLLLDVTPRWRPMLWLMLPFATWLLSYQVLVSPAENRLAQAQLALLAAERDEMAAALEVEREELTVERMQRRVETMVSDAARLRRAEQAARVELDRGQAAHERHSVGMKRWNDADDEMVVQRT